MTALWYTITVAPPVWLVRTLLLTPLSRVLYLTTLPARALLTFILAILTFLSDLIRVYESLLIFIGTAIVIGAVAGGILHIMSRGFASLLGAGDLGDEDAHRAATRTLADYRKARQRRKVEDERAARSATSWASNPVGDASGLVRSTILEEEEDSEF